MRELNLQQAALVAGGNDTLGNGMDDVSLVQPDSSNVTVTYQWSEGAVTLTAKCVDYRRSLHSEDSTSESGV